MINCFHVLLIHQQEQVTLCWDFRAMNAPETVSEEKTTADASWILSTPRSDVDNVDAACSPGLTFRSKLIETCVCCRVNRPEHTFSIYMIPSARWHCNKIVPSQKLLTMTSVDCLELPGQDLWKEALLSLFRSGSFWDGLKLFLKNEDDKSRL